MLGAEFFEVSDNDTVGEAWLTTVNLLDILEHVHGMGKHYNFVQARTKVAKIYCLAESHHLDNSNAPCLCGLSASEHALLRRKILSFFRLLVRNLKHFLH